MHALQVVGGGEVLVAGYGGGTARDGGVAAGGVFVGVGERRAWLVGCACEYAGGGGCQIPFVVVGVFGLEGVAAVAGDFFDASVFKGVLPAAQELAVEGVVDPGGFSDGAPDNGAVEVDGVGDVYEGVGEVAAVE